MNKKKPVSQGVKDADNFALNMRAVRRRKEIQIIDLAKAMHVTEYRIASIERGSCAIRLDEAIDASEILQEDFWKMLKGVIPDVED